MVHPVERLDRPAASKPETETLEQDIRFCVAPDGVGLAYSVVGEGPTIVKTANWLSRLEFDFKSQIWRPWIEELSDGYSILRYDARGNGLSDWDVDDISFDAWVSDLEVVVDAAQVDRFALFGISQGCAVSLAYAVGHPDKLSHLILFAGSARGRFKRPGANPEQEKAIDTLLRLGWGSESHPLSQTLAANLMADGGPREQAWWVDLQRMTTSPNNAVRIRQVLQTYDVEDLLPEVSVPTLVLHREGDTAVPFEEGRRMASRIPGARFVSLPGRNHILIDGQEAWGRFFSEVRNFLKS